MATGLDPRLARRPTVGRSVGVSVFGSFAFASMTAVAFAGVACRPASPSPTTHRETVPVAHDRAANTRVREAAREIDPRRVRRVVFTFGSGTEDVDRVLRATTTNRREIAAIRNAFLRSTRDRERTTEPGGETTLGDTIEFVMDRGASRAFDIVDADPADRWGPELARIHARFKPRAHPASRLAP